MRAGGGEMLCKALAPARGDGIAEPRWFLYPSNKDLGPRSAEKACALLTPSQDGLFGDEFSQTWGA